MHTLPTINISKKQMLEFEDQIVYGKDSMRELTQNDSRRYFQSDAIDKDMIPRMQKIDSYFATTRKYVMGQNGIATSKLGGKIIDPEVKLKQYTKHPMTYYRALESEKSKKVNLQIIQLGLSAINEPAAIN